jgi:hypothetical protein
MNLDGEEGAEGGSEEPLRKKDRVLTYLENSLTLPIPHVELPNLDLGGLSNFRVFESSFQFQWEHPPWICRNLWKCKKNVHDMEEGLQILYRERGVIGQQVEALEFKMEQVKHFANFCDPMARVFRRGGTGYGQGYHKFHKTTRRNGK